MKVSIQTPDTNGTFEMEEPFGRVLLYLGDVFSAVGTAPVKADDETLEEITGLGYKGFIIARCGSCGATRGFCTRSHIRFSYCKECGAKTLLRDLKPATISCQCGQTFRYRTNITDDTFLYPCLACGRFHRLELNAAKTAFANYDDAPGIEPEGEKEDDREEQVSDLGEDDQDEPDWA